MKKGEVKIYSCGPTVYGPPHIGNLRAYIFTDTLRRSLEFLDYKVTQVVNITDVGHLTSDSDAGEDKIEKGAKATGKTVWEVAKMYEEQFFTALEALNIKKPNKLPRATEHIKEQVNLIQKLTDKGFTYETSDGIYFDTSKFKNYGKLSGQKLEDKEAGARVAVKSEKRNPADFALWKFCVGENANHVMRWPNPPQSPLDKGKSESAASGRAEGFGFPGWHIECSAMSMKYLGETFDIHTGGIDHVPVHHENEIAQSEAATGQPFVKYWLHNEFLTVDGRKMSKSLGNLFTLEDLKKKFKKDLMAFRMMCLGAHYRKKVNFTEKSLKNYENALFMFKLIYEALPDGGKQDDNYIGEFKVNIADDLNTPKAIATAFKVIRDKNLKPADRKATFKKMDEVLGLNLDSIHCEIVLSKRQKEILKEREAARKERNWDKSDTLRAEFEKGGTKDLTINDNPNGQKIIFKIE